MRTPLIAGNWKMNKTNSEAVGLVRELKRLVSDVRDREILVCPPYTALSDVSREIDNSNIKLGAQDVFYEKSGAFTSKISPAMLTDIGCEYVIIGHSETRQLFHETNDNVNKKIKAAIHHKLMPILCVGETLEERKQDKTLQVIEVQLENGLRSVDLKNIVVAYEPVWAIGTGRTASPEQAQEAHAFIRKIVGEDIRILYGGSVKPSNIKELMQQKDIDGALVGGASLNAEEFSKIVKF